MANVITLNKHYLKLLAIFLFLFAWRASGHFYAGALSDHIGNFIFTGLAFLVVMGPKIYQQGRYTNELVIAAIVLASANVILELLVNVDEITLPLGITFVNFNTTDPWDIPFGILALLVILVLSRTRMRYYL